MTDHVVEIAPPPDGRVRKLESPIKGLVWISALSVALALTCLVTALVFGGTATKIITALVFGLCLVGLPSLWFLVTTAWLDWERFKRISVISFLAIIGFVTVVAIDLERAARRRHDALAASPPHELRAPAQLTLAPVDQDSLQIALLNALQQSPRNDASFIPALPSLAALAREKPDLLRRYLEASAAWRVLEHHGHLFASRRWRTALGWERIFDSNLPVSATDSRGESPGSFHFHITICLDDTPRAERPQAVRLKEGTDLQSLALGRRANLDTSWLEIQCGPVLLEVAEETPGRERRLTRAALVELEQDFRAVYQRGEFSSAVLPPDSVREGAATLELLQQPEGRWVPPNSYLFRAWANPGEPGGVWLKAVELGSEKAYDEAGVREDSSQKIGWSTDFRENFAADGGIYFGEGEQTLPYRIELWFKPESGRPERLLLSREYRIGPASPR